MGLALNTSCNNDDDTHTDSIGQLPPATQTGEQTFGCLINGEAFVPDNFGRGRPNAFYQFKDGNYTFIISSSSGRGEGLVRVTIGGLDVEPLEAKAYSLNQETSGNIFGALTQSWLRFTTNQELPGTLTITNFDPENYIISGTFEFTVINEEGKEIHITNGRFDMLYTN